MGIEPTTPGATVRCSNQLSYGHHVVLVTAKAIYERRTTRVNQSQPKSGKVKESERKEPPLLWFTLFDFR